MAMVTGAPNNFLFSKISGLISDLGTQPARFCLRTVGTLSYQSLTPCYVFSNGKEKKQLQIKLFFVNLIHDPLVWWENKDVYV